MLAVQAVDGTFQKQSPGQCPYIEHSDLRLRWSMRAILKLYLELPVRDWNQTLLTWCSWRESIDGVLFYPFARELLRQRGVCPVLARSHSILDLLVLRLHHVLFVVEDLPNVTKCFWLHELRLHYPGWSFYPDGNALLHQVYEVHKYGGRTYFSNQNHLGRSFVKFHGVFEVTWSGLLWCNSFGTAGAHKVTGAFHKVLHGFGLR